jgi:hypothetical protein
MARDMGAWILAASDDLHPARVAWAARATSMGTGAAGRRSGPRYPFGRVLTQSIQCNEQKGASSMATALTVIQGFLVIGFTAGGLAQLFVPYARYTQLPAQAWANDFQPWHVKLIGALKVSATVGMIAALFLPSLMILLPLAAVGLALVMAGAMATHLRREEYPNVIGNLVYLGLALFVAYESLVAIAV